MSDPCGPDGRDFGLVPQTYPQIDVIQWNVGWLRIGSTTGPVTTRWRTALRRRTTRPDRQALGFWTGRFGTPTRVEIRMPNPDGSPGAMAAAGDIYIYPEAGQTFDGLSQIYSHIAGSYPGAVDYSWARTATGKAAVTGIFSSLT